MMITGNKHISKVLLTILVIGFLCSCEKETVKEWLDYNDFTSVVGPQSRTVRFFMNNSGIPEELFPVIDFEENTFDEETRIGIEYIKLYGLGLPIELSTIAKENYLWFFDSQNKPLNKNVTIHMPLPDDLSEYMLDGYTGLLRVYRINRNKSYRELSNWIHVQDAVFNTAENEFTVSTGDLDYGYCILFPEIKKNDQLIIEGRGEVLSYYFDKAICIQHLINIAYFTPESEDDKGFYSYEGLSYFSGSGYWNQVFTISFVFRGQGPGTYSGDDMNLVFRTVLLEDGSYLYNFGKTANTIIKVDEYGEIGEYVTGTITGILKLEEYIDEIDFYCYFRVKRTR